MPCQHATTAWVCPSVPVYSLRLLSDAVRLTEAPSYLPHCVDLQEGKMNSCSHQMVLFTW